MILQHPTEPRIYLHIPQAKSEIEEARFIQRINNEDIFFFF